MPTGSRGRHFGRPLRDPLEPGGFFFRPSESKTGSYFRLPLFKLAHTPFFPLSIYSVQST
jgi:hypothetical protein